MQKLLQTPNIVSMTNLSTVIFFSLIGGIVSLLGGLLLLSRKSFAGKLAKYATPFAAGALLGAAFLDLLPEGIEAGEADEVLIFTLLGIISFFFFERFLNWFHHHHVHVDSKLDPKASMIIVGDTVHNFIDGVAIAAAFLISVPSGVVATLAVAAHEIPQEIGDFGLLLNKGFSRRAVIIVNIVSAMATTVAAVLFFQLGQGANFPVEALLGLTAGFFIYIAVSDIIPSIHKQSKHKVLIDLPAILLVAGVLVVGIAATTLHDQIDVGHDHDSHSHEEEAHHDEDDDHHEEDHEDEDDHDVDEDHEDNSTNTPHQD